MRVGRLGVLMGAVCALAGTVPWVASCGAGGIGAATAQVALLSLSPQSTPAAQPFQLVLNGSNFSQLAGTSAIVRLTALNGAPFAGGTSDTCDCPTTVRSDTLIEGDSPGAICVPPDTEIDCTCVVVLPSGFEMEAEGMLLTLQGASVSGGGLSPTEAQADFAVPFTISGSGFGPDGGAVSVTFSCPTATPFQGGTQASVDVPGTIGNGGTEITGMSPVANLASEADLVSDVSVTLDAACGSTGSVPLGTFTFRTPTATSIQALVSGSFQNDKLPAGSVFRVTGTGFGPPATTPSVRFQAVAGAPFDLGTETFVDVAGALVSPTEITGTVPQGVPVTPYDCTVSVILDPTGNRATVPGAHQMLPPPFVPNDPRFAQQWHWENTGQTSGTVGEDVNVRPAWDCGITGTGVIVGVCDSGVDFLHEDLDENKDLLDSWNPRTDSPRVEPTSLPYAAGRHGTVVSGMIAARGGNALGLCGVAPHASIADLPLAADTSFSVNDAQFMRAQTHAMQNISVRNNSWGFGALGYWIRGGPTWLDTLETGLTVGRGGLGNAYCWSSGNAGTQGDWANEDEHHNHRACLTVGSVDHNGRRESYSTPGACLWISNYGGGASAPRHGVVSTDEHDSWGYVAGDYLVAANGLQGTSFSSPATAGVVALLLQANPGLYVRDIKEILARTARRNDPNSQAGVQFSWLVAKGLHGWQTNAAGLHFNINYGFGVPDCAAAVDMARRWTPIPPTPPHVDTTHQTVSVAVPDDDTTGVTFAWDLGAATITSMDQIEILFSTSHQQHAHFGLLLTSPGGTTIPLAVPRAPVQNNGPLVNYLLSTGGFLGEAAAGTWSLKVTDERAGATGTITGLVLRIYGR